MFDGANLTLISDVDQANRCLVRMKDPELVDVPSPCKYKSRYKKGDETKIRIQQYNKRPCNY